MVALDGILPPYRKYRQAWLFCCVVDDIRYLCRGRVGKFAWFRFKVFRWYLCSPYVKSTLIFMNEARVPIVNQLRIKWNEGKLKHWIAWTCCNWIFCYFRELQRRRMQRERIRLWYFRGVLRFGAARKHGSSDKRDRCQESWLWLHSNKWLCCTHDSKGHSRVGRERAMWFTRMQGSAFTGRSNGTGGIGRLQA